MQEFPGAGAPLFKAASNKDKDDDENEEDNAEGGEYEPNVAFEPVVPLPALVEVSTGEEEEKVLFCDRGFLYRFVPDTKEWKEKGRGDMKILEHKKTGRTRLLMRREQVCCSFPSFILVFYYLRIIYIYAGVEDLLQPWHYSSAVFETAANIRSYLDMDSSGFLGERTSDGNLRSQIQDV